MGEKINALDLFAGAGGFSLGMENAGISVIAAVEFNKQIAKTYKYNHPDTTLIVNDIRKISSESIEEIFKAKRKVCDVIFGGPPCQGFSMAGYRIRTNFSFFEDERNSLFKEFVRFVKSLNPKIFVLENVPGIMNYNNGSVRTEIYETFEKLGYNIHSEVLCAADYGVPQFRKRAIFIGNRLGLRSKELFPKPSHSPKNYVSVYDAISDLPEIEAGLGSEEMKYTSFDNLSKYQKRLRSERGFIFNHTSSRHKKETLDILTRIKQGQTMKDLPKEMRTRSVHSGAYGRMIYNKPAYTLTTRLNTPSVGRITHPVQNRTITPREAARIQSFPDDYRFLGDVTSIGIQIGNAVPPLLAQKIGQKIKAVLIVTSKTS